MTNTGQSLAFQGHGGLGNDEEASMYRYGPYTPKSLERFILKLSRRLKEGSNVVLRVPSPNLNQDFLKTIQRVVKDSAGPELIPLDASKRKDSKSLHAFLNLELSSKRQARRQKSLEALFQSDNGHSAVYMITGLDSWIEPAKKKAASELSEVAANTLGHASKGKASGQRPGGYLFLAIVDPLFPLPDKNLGLTILDWWGVTSPSDHEFMFEGIMADHNPPHSQDMYWWLKAMSFSVGGDDPLLIGSIVREAPLTLIDVKGLLLSHPLAKEKLATDHFPKDLLFRNLSPDPGSPPERPSERRLWAAGLLAPNRYSLYHPVMLARDDKILEKIIAMGQREVFFPLTDQVHAFISYAVEEIIGSIEPLFGGGEEGAYKYEQAQTEIRFLRDTLKNLAIPAHPKVHELYELQHLATLWVYIRNLNAHIQMLRHDKLKTAMEYYAKLYKNVIPGRDSN